MESDNSTSYWWLFGIIVFIIIFIIIYFIFNNNNQLNILDSIPNYNIYYPKNETYLNIINVPSVDNPKPYYITQNAGNNYPSLFWKPIVNATKQKNQVSVWKLEPIAKTSFDNLPPESIYIYVINTFYYDLAPLDKNLNHQGYLYAKSISNDIMFAPDTSITNAYKFIYTKMDNNMFTLTSSEDTTKKVDIDVNGNMVLSSTNAIFQLTTKIF